MSARVPEFMGTKVVRAKLMTSECWFVQVWGLRACRGCDEKGTKECGGERIRKLIRAGKFSKTGLPDVRQEEKK